MSNPGLMELCLFCGSKSPGPAFCSEKCRHLATSGTRSASEPSSPTIGLSRTLSEFCQLRSLPKAIDFGNWISNPGHKTSEPDKSYSISVGRPQQISDLSEKTSHELKEYERCFDQTRRQKTQVSTLFHSRLHLLVLITNLSIAQAKFNLYQ